MLDGLKLRWRSRPSLVDQILGETGPPKASASEYECRRVAAIQMAYREAEDPSAWIEQCQALATAAAQAGATVIAFPALASLGLVASLVGQEMAATLATGNASFGDGSAGPWRAVLPAQHRLFHRTFSFLAHRHGVIVVAGVLAAPAQRGEPPFSACVFGPDGRLRLRRKATLGPLALGDTEPAQIEGVRLTVRIGGMPTADSLAFATAASGLLAMLPVFGGETDELPVAALAQTPGSGLVSANLVGRIGSLLLRGRSGIYVPAEVGGVAVTETSADDAEEVIVAPLTRTSAPDGDRPADQERPSHRVPAQGGR